MKADTSDKPEKGSDSEVINKPDGWSGSAMNMKAEGLQKPGKEHFSEETAKADVPEEPDNYMDRSAEKPDDPEKPRKAHLSEEPTKADNPEDAEMVDRYLDGTAMNVKADASDKPEKAGDSEDSVKVDGLSDCAKEMMADVLEEAEKAHFAGEPVNVGVPQMLDNHMDPHGTP